MSANPLERVAFQNAQELRLNLQRHLADFVEEQRASVGLLKLSDFSLGRSSK